MEIKIQHLKDIVIISLKGSLASESVPELKKMFDDSLQANRVRVVVDLKDVDFIDTTALAIFVTRSQDFHKRGGSLSLAGINDSLLRILESLCLTSFFRIFNDVDQACKSF